MYSLIFSVYETFIKLIVHIDVYIQSHQGNIEIGVGKKYIIRYFNMVWFTNYIGYIYIYIFGTSPQTFL
jgi:hypothetical protein